MDFDSRLRLIVETIGAKTAMKQINRIKATTANAAKANQKIRSKFGISGQGYKGGATAQQKQLEETLSLKAKQTAEIKKARKAAIKENKVYDKKKQIQHKLRRDGMQLNKIGKKSLQRVKDEAHYQKVKNKEAKRFKAHYLSIMFAGMQLQRVFGGLFKNMIKTYKEFTKNAATPMSDALTRLEANWKFLKFQIIEAMGPGLSGFADWIADLAHAIAKMNPETLELVGYTILGLAGLGGLSMVFGQGALLFSGLASAAANKAGLLSVENTIRETHGLDPKKLNAGTSFWNSMRKAAGISISLVAGAMTIQDILKKQLTPLKDIFADVALGGIGIGLATGSLGKGVIASGVIALSLGLSNAGKILMSGKQVEFGTILQTSLSTGIGAGLVFGKAAAALLGVSAVGAGLVAGIIAAGTVMIILEARNNMVEEAREGFEELDLLARKEGYSFSLDEEGMTNMVQFFTKYGTKIAELKALQEGTSTEVEMAGMIESYNKYKELWEGKDITTAEFATRMKDMLDVQFLTNKELEKVNEELKNIPDNIREDVLPEMKSFRKSFYEITGMTTDINKDIGTRLRDSISNAAEDLSKENGLTMEANLMKKEFKDAADEAERLEDTLKRISRLEGGSSSEYGDSGYSSNKDEANYFIP